MEFGFYVVTGVIVVWVINSIIASVIGGKEYWESDIPNDDFY